MKHTKKFTSLLLTLIMILALVPVAHAETYKYPVGGGEILFDPTTGTITSCSKMVYEANIPEEILGVPVTKIGRSAFWARDKLQKVIIPPTVTEIGETSNGSSVFGSSSLNEITIPNSVTKIGNSAFVCTKLKTLTIPGSVKVVEKFLCDRCSDLSSVTLEEGITKIEAYAFVECTSLTEIRIPDSVEEIDNSAFARCKSLSTVTLGHGIEFIDDRAFAYCPSLEKVYFCGDAPSLGKHVFEKASSQGIILYYPEGANGWTTPTWNGYITKSYKLNDNSSPTTPTQPQNLTTTGQQVDAWALNLVNEAIAANLMPDNLGADLRSNITREQFAGITVKLYEAMSGTIVPTPALADNIFTDTSNADVRKAYSMGFVSGTSSTTFSPNSPLNREQAAVMLANVYRAMGGIISTRNPGTFSDDASISGWAKNAVYFMAENGIISGVGNNKFSAQGKTQSQAALVIALKMLQNLK